MKNLILAAVLVLPTLSFANTFDCSGAGFSIDGNTTPAEMRINGNGFNDANSINTRSISTFDTIVTGSLTAPVATVKLTIKDGEARSTLLVSSSAGIKEFSGLTCFIK